MAISRRAGGTRSCEILRSDRSLARETRTRNSTFSKLTLLWQFTSSYSTRKNRDTLLTVHRGAGRCPLILSYTPTPLPRPWAMLLRRHSLRERKSSRRLMSTLRNHTIGTTMDGIRINAHVLPMVVVPAPPNAPMANNWLIICICDAIALLAVLHTLSLALYF